MRAELDRRFSELAEERRADAMAVDDKILSALSATSESNASLAEGLAARMDRLDAEAQRAAGEHKSQFADIMGAINRMSVQGTGTAETAGEAATVNEERRRRSEEVARREEKARQAQEELSRRELELVRREQEYMTQVQAAETANKLSQQGAGALVVRPAPGDCQAVLHVPKENKVRRSSDVDNLTPPGCGSQPRKRREEEPVLPPTQQELMPLKRQAMLIQQAPAQQRELGTAGVVPAAAALPSRPRSNSVPAAPEAISQSRSRSNSAVAMTEDAEWHDCCGDDMPLAAWEEDTMSIDDESPTQGDRADEFPRRC